MDQERPVIVGTLAMQGSSYGDHWVVAYQYNDGQSLYKCIDNHGRQAATINVSWTSGVVYMA